MQNLMPVQDGITVHSFFVKINTTLSMITGSGTSLMNGFKMCNMYIEIKIFIFRTGFLL